MNKGEEHKELIQQMADRLRNHTEPYKAGAWERFAAAYGNKRRRPIWPYWSAAAILLATIGLYLATQQPNELPTQPQLAQPKVTPPPTVSAEAERDEPDRTHAGTVADLMAFRANDSIKKVPQQSPSEERGLGERDIADQAPALAVVAVDTMSTPDRVSHRLATAIEVDGTGQQTRDTPRDIIFNGEAANTDAYAGNTAAYARTSPKAERDTEKWDLGLMVSPSLTSEKVNFGGGVAVAYRISDKFSIGSGVSVAQLGIGENPNHQPRHEGAFNNPSASDYFNGKSEAAVDYIREVSVTSSVVTLDIPLDVRYDVGKGFYTSVGLSYVAVLGEQRTSHIVDRLNKNTLTNSGSLNADRLAMTEFVYSSERIPAQPLRGNGYAGFMNFSVGKKVPMTSKLFLSVEPYFKLPIGRLSKEEMDFTNGGIRIVTGF